MDPVRERIQADLRGIIAGDVLCDDAHVQLYASDASLYEIAPLGIVRPRHTKDVSACLQYAFENHLPVHCRGAGTGLAGESLGAGLILDCSAYMRRILKIDEESVRVQPGVIHSHLNDVLAPRGRTFGPDPAMSKATTVGSVIAIDASGSHWLKYGSARTHVRSLQVVLDTGEILELGQESLDADTGYQPPRKREIIQRLAELLTREADLIRAKQPNAASSRAGYRLEGVLGPQTLDLAKLLSGSEGTLAVITEATIATQPLPRARGLTVLLFDRLESAALAVQDLLPLAPSAVDLLDRRHISLARESSPEYHAVIPAETEALLLVEFLGDDPSEIRRQLQQAAEIVRTRRRLAFDTRQALAPEEIDMYWELAHRVVPTLNRTKGAARPLPFIEDVAVPPAALPDFLPKMQNVLKRHQVVASLYGHVGHGQLHLRPFLDLRQADDFNKIEALAAELYQEVRDSGGTISGEHGDGLSRTPYIRQQYGELYPVFREVKRIFDPHHLLNPGKIISDDVDTLTKYIRPSLLRPFAETSSASKTFGPAPTTPPDTAAAVTGTLVPLQLNWNGSEMEQAAARCNGCGLCRAQTPDLRMCPIFRVLPVESASPRAKANLVRAIFDGRLSADSVQRDEVKEIADLCVNCHMCRQECPANVDIPKLVLEVKGAFVADNGQSPSDWLLARPYWYSALGSIFAPLSNWAIGNRAMRWLLEKITGVAQGRKLPRFARRNFLRKISRGRNRLTRPSRRTGQKVAYFVDTYATYHDPQLAEALVAILEHNGISVYVPPGQGASGMSLFSAGAIGAAKKLARRNIAILAEAVRLGYHIITTEPSAALCLTHEYLNVQNDDDAKLVADNTSDASAFLWHLHQQGKLQLDFQPVNYTVGYHLPCHLKALNVGSPGENLLRLVPALSVKRIEKGCSGMAGMYGLKRTNFRNSIRAGWGLISSLRHQRWHAGTTECASCKIQMEQGTTKPTIHPLKLLALAYNLMPEIGDLLNKTGEDLIVT